MWETTFRFFEAGGARCVGEESRSAIRGLGARLRSLRRVAGVDMMTPGQCWRGCQVSKILHGGAATPRILGGAQKAQCLDVLTKPNAALGVSHTSEFIGGTYCKYNKCYCRAAAQKNTG